MASLIRHFLSVALLASLVSSGRAAGVSCFPSIPVPSGGCNTWDLTGLGSGTFDLTDSADEVYLVSSPCALVDAADVSKMCTDTQHPPIVPTSAYQVHNAGCIDLGVPSALSVSALNGNASLGVSIQFAGGDDTIGCSIPRTVTYNIICDPSASSSNPPEAMVTTAPGNNCAYIVTWRHPAGCSKFNPSETCIAPYPGPYPTQPQLQYQKNEIMALIHFNMATFAGDGDPGCNAQNWNHGVNSSNPATFNPTQLNTDNWFESMIAVGAKEAVLTAKHGCGFLLWPTNVTLPDGSPYTYCVGKEASAIKQDVLSLFRASAEKYGIGHGFYYSLTNNFYLNVLHHYVQNTPLLPGQVKVTQDQFEAIALAQVSELWHNYGNLTEIWFDGGYTGDMQAAITALLNATQVNAVTFNGYGVSKNPIRWVGTETGMPSKGIWSMGVSDGQGDPTSDIWAPAGCDTTLQEGDHWFWMPNTPIRSLAELIQVYHATVGNNGVLELDFAIDRDGVVDPVHAQRYVEFGAWIRSCYGTAVAQTSAVNSTQIVLRVPSSVTVDRIMIQEDLAQGQRVRSYVVEYLSSSGSYVQFSTGTAVGNKRIDLGSQVNTSAFRLTITNTVGAPLISNFAVFAPCASE